MPKLVDTLVFSTSPNTTSPAIIWNDLNLGLPAAAAGGGPAFSTFKGGGGLATYLFSAGAVNQVYGTEELLHNYKEGTNISFHIHWLPTTTSTGTILWGVEYAWQNVENSSLNTLGTPSTQTILATTTGTAERVYVTGFPDIDGTGKKVGSQIMFRIFRAGNDPTDTYAQSVGWLSAGIHYQCDTVGSRQKFIK